MTTTIRFRLAATLTSVVLVALAACSSGEAASPDTRPDPPPTLPPPLPDEQVVGTHVVTWSEETVDWDVLEPARGDRLIRTVEERDAYVELVEPGLDASALTAVDMDQHLLVVATWARCDEYAEVVLSADRSTLEIRVISESGGDVVCVWAPLQVAVWQIERDLVAEDVVLARD